LALALGAVVGAEDAGDGEAKLGGDVPAQATRARPSGARSRRRMAQGRLDRPCGSGAESRGMRAIVRGDHCPTYPPPMDVAAIWRTYGGHAGLVLRAGPGLTTTTTAGSFTAFSGAPHVDLNQAALFGPATAADATAIVDAAAGRDIPVLLALSSAVHDPDPIRALL